MACWWRIRAAAAAERTAVAAARALGRLLECVGRRLLRHRRDACEALQLVGAAAASAVSSVFCVEASGGAWSGLEQSMSSNLGDLRLACATLAGMSSLRGPQVTLAFTRTRGAIASQRCRTLRPLHPRHAPQLGVHFDAQQLQNTH